MKVKRLSENTVLVLTIVLSLLTSCATLADNDLASENARISETFEIPGIEKSRLFILANSWAVDMFVSADSVIEFSDKDAGILKGKYVTTYYEGIYTYDLRSTITIEVKDNYARITIADPYYRATSGLGQTYYNIAYRPLQSQKSFTTNCVPKYQELIKLFKKAMIQNTKF